MACLCKHEDETVNLVHASQLMKCELIGKVSHTPFSCSVIITDRKRYGKLCFSVHFNCYFIMP